MTDEEIASLRDQHIRRIKILNETIWESRVGRPVIDQWLDNFGDADGMERLYALFLLSQFTYFGWSEVRELLKSVYRDYYRAPILRAIRERNSNTRDMDKIEEEFVRERDKTRFVPIGNPSESSALLLYFFRQEHELPKSLFSSGHWLFTRTKTEVQLRFPEVTRYVFLDDVCGSGKQVVSYTRELLTELKRLQPDAELHYYVLFGTAKGMDHVANRGLFTHVDRVYELDASFRCFDPQSRYFIAENIGIDKDAVEAMCQRYGDRLRPDCPLGYDDDQLLLGLGHNTPDNTLPIFWYNDPNWSPVFRRYEKLYS